MKIKKKQIFSTEYETEHCRYEVVVFDDFSFQLTKDNFFLCAENDSDLNFYPDDVQDWVRKSIKDAKNYINQ